MLVLTFSSKLDWGSYIISIAKTACKKIGALIRSMTFLCISINIRYPHVILLSRLGWCPHLLLGIVTETSYKNGYVGFLVLHLLLLLNPNLIVIMWPAFFYRYYFGRCSSELVQLFPLPFSQGRSTCYSDRLHDFSVTIPRC